MAWGAPRGLDDLVSRLHSNDPTLQALYLLRTRRLDEPDFVALCGALASNTVLVDLNISSHCVTTTMAASFAAVLAANRVLQILCLGNSTFGDEVNKALS